MKKLLSIILISFSSYLSATKVAVAIKITGNVSIHYAGENNKQTLKPGSPLSSRDKIVTGKNGFALIMYLDDKTTLKILKNSTLEILGDRSDKTINKSIDIKYGKVAANVKPQNGKDFTISTPTSVASVKGTEFAVSSDPSTGDSFTLLEGLIEVTNSITGQSTDVQEGETAVSSPDGSLDVSQTTEEDLNNFQDANIEMPAQELKFEIEDEDGNTKEIIIKFQ